MTVSEALSVSREHPQVGWAAGSTRCVGEPKTLDRPKEKGEGCGGRVPRFVRRSAEREARGLCPRIGSVVVVVHSAKGGVADVILGARASNWNGHREQAATGA
jgi:hypothetical protein